MIRSMTGFGREHQIIDGREILVEIRSVNHRYFEFSSKLPRSYMYLEDKLKSLLQGKISRGKVEISVSIYNVSGKETQITVNPMVVEGYVNSLREVKDKFDLKDNLALSDVFKMTDAFNVLKADVDEDEIWKAVEGVTQIAMDRFITMRETEGERMKSDILSRLSDIEAMVGEVEKISPDTVSAYRARLFEKMQEILQNNQVDEQRILLEAALFSEKTAVDEETVRLRSHISQFRAMLENEDNIGRKLDFLVQEVNREVNTIGSKAQDLRVTKIIVDAKSEIEKIREQIQNVE